MIRKAIIYCAILWLPAMGSYAQSNVQDTIRLAIGEAVEIAQKQSPDIVVARHSFRSSYWNYCYYKANYLPSLTLTSTPNFDHRINVITLADGTSQYKEQNQLRTDGALVLSQNVPWTGGTLAVKSSLQRLDMFGNYKSHTYMSNLLTVSYEQSLLGYNYLKWDKRIEPLRFEEAKRNYVETLELVAAATATRFFDLARAQSNWAIAKTNYANADTLYTFAKGRYDIGTITESEMLQLEINCLNEESNMLNAQIEVDNTMQILSTYLGLTDGSLIEVVIEEHVPEFMVDVAQAVNLAMTHSPDIITFERRKRESQSNVAYAKAQSGLKADLFAQFGLTQTGEKIAESYKSPLDQQYVQVGIRLPILDWGRGKGRIRVAQSNKDMVYTQVEQDMTTFEQNIVKAVRQFNLQANKVKIAAKTDYTAHRRSDIARRLYILGRSNILDLNSAISEKDTAKRSYINALYNYWALYYTLRSLTLYDFEKKIALTEDYALLLK